MKGKHPIEIAELKYPPDTRLRNDKTKVTIKQPDPLQRTDQHAEPKGCLLYTSDAADE